MTTAATDRRTLPTFRRSADTPGDGPLWEFEHRGLSLSTYRPLGFDAGTAVTYGWSVFWDINPEAREEITGGWSSRAAAVRVALTAIDQRAQSNASHQRKKYTGAHPEPGRCCEHLDARHLPGRYGHTRCATRKCRCVMYRRGPLVPIRPEDIPAGAVLSLHTSTRGVFEFPVSHSGEGTRPATIDRPRTNWVRATTAAGLAAEFATGSVVYALAHTVPDSTPRAE